ncbi:MAG: hypothetical protein V3T72_11260 [Thermoanaerobaculia bacterium]
MFADNKYFTHPLKALGIFAYIVLATASPETLLAAPDRCTTVIPLTAGETWRDPGREAAEKVCFDLGVEGPGLVALDLVSSSSTTDPAVPRARLVFDGPGRLQQTPTSLVTVWPSGIYRIRVESEDPRQPLPPFRLATRFSAEVSKSETDSETELDPDPFSGCGAKSETDSETELDPDPLADCGVKSDAPHDADVYDLSRVPAAVRPHLAEICRRASSDDHGDSLLCATALTPDRTISGEIANDWGDDSDVFRFQMKKLALIEIDVRGDAELVVALYDRYGLRLSAGSDGGSRLTRSLVPGTYFVRLMGRSGAAGRYELSVGSTDR